MNARFEELKTLPGYHMEIVEQNTEILNKILKQNEDILEINKQILEIIANPMVKCTTNYKEEETSSGL